MRQSAKAFLQDKLQALTADDIEIIIGHLDSRLRLTQCESDLDTFLPSGSKLQGKLSVGVRCASPKPWTVYMPAQIRIYKEIIAAAHPLGRGTQVSEADIIQVRQEVSGFHSGYFEEAGQVVGKVMTRPLNAGQVFTPNKLKAALLIKRGEEVTIVASTGTLEVRSRGKALKDAAEGESLTVRNINSNRVIQVIAVKPGIVIVPM